MEKEARGRRGKGRGKRAEATGASSRSEATWVSDDARTYHGRVAFCSLAFLSTLSAPLASVFVVGQGTGASSAVSCIVSYKKKQVASQVKSRREPSEPSEGRM